MTTPDSSGRRVQVTLDHDDNLSWTVRDGSSIRAGHLWSAGRDIKTTNMRLLKDCFGSDQPRTVPVEIRNWIVIDHNVAGKNKPDFAMVLGMRSLRFGKAHTNLICISWGYPLATVDFRNRASSKKAVLKAIDDMELDGDDIVLSNHLEAVDQSMIVSKVDEDADGQGLVVTRDCLPHKDGARINLCSGIYICKTPGINELVLKMGSSTEEENGGSRPTASQHTPSAGQSKGRARSNQHLGRLHPIVGATEVRLVMKGPSGIDDGQWEEEEEEDDDDEEEEGGGGVQTQALDDRFEEGTVEEKDEDSAPAVSVSVSTRAHRPVAHPRSAWL
ncbi:Hypothetical protein D9617_20g028780 [Elsinoe fawcettii]|nr:Hypothetical protein D9617_20g028780 [Elsinoe fawcettii]